MKRKPLTNELFKINVSLTVLSILANLAIFFFIETNSFGFTVLSCCSNIALLFVYFWIILGNLNHNLPKYRNEILYINYPLQIAMFFVFLFLILAGSIITLLVLNKEAANTAAMLTFFLTAISVLMPSLVFIAVIYFISPALIIPALKTDKQSKGKYQLIYVLLLIIFAVFCLFKALGAFDRAENFESKNKYKTSKITVKFSAEPLKTGKNITPYAKKLMDAEKMEVPFFYTSDFFRFSKYEDAEAFCKSMDARVPNYLEAFHIAFNNFDTFGNKYYWTSNKDEKIPVVIHFQNMAYVAERLPEKVKPMLYCVSSADDNFGFANKPYFYKNTAPEKSAAKKPLNKNKKSVLQDIDDLIKKETKSLYETGSYDAEIKSGKRHVSFSVKEVSPDYMRQLIQEGYDYNPALNIKREYETTETKLKSVLDKDTKNIRLCYYPFTEYVSMDINQERQIWEQSFCSPAFTVINTMPSYVSENSKNSYCRNLGGRLPNIPELAAILKVSGSDVTGAKYWTNNRIIDKKLNNYVSVEAHYKDSRFMEVRSVTSNEDAYAYCIKPAAKPSKVIANYKSKFKGYDGNNYFSRYCPDCYYYEIPDVIIRR